VKAIVDKADDGNTNATTNNNNVGEKPQKMILLPPSTEYAMLCEHVMAGLRRELGPEPAIDASHLLRVLDLLKERANMPNDFVRMGAHFFVPHGVKKGTTTAPSSLSSSQHDNVLTRAMELVDSQQFDALDTLHDALGLRKRDVLSLLRSTLTGLEVGAPISGTAKVLGRERALMRLKGGSSS
jgi:hypothetical protein